MSDIDYHGFVAKKRRLRENTFVTESRLDNIVVGTEIKYLNGTALCDLQPTDVMKLFRSRTIKLVPSASQLDSSMVRILFQKLKLFKKYLFIYCFIWLCRLCLISIIMASSRKKEG